MVDYFGSSTPSSRVGPPVGFLKIKKKKLVAFSITESKNRVQFRTNVKSYLLTSDDLFTISGIQMKEDKRPVESKTCGFADYNTSKASTLQETSASKFTLYRSQSLRLNRKKNTKLFPSLLCNTTFCSQFIFLELLILAHFQITREVVVPDGDELLRIISNKAPTPTEIYDITPQFLLPSDNYEHFAPQCFNPIEETSYPKNNIDLPSESTNV
ncbi:unnamed protein product [Rhizophagus irregularis]|nr:unnamed protein product [Rhizophagus irregularis]